MKRNDFLKRVIVTSTSVYLLPSLLSACGEEDNKATTVDWDGKVIIIGAGAAGLQAAQTLRKAGVKFIDIFEASDKWGGRIRALSSFADFPIELGAEEIHGENTRLKAIFDNQGRQLIDSEATGEDYYFYNNSLQTGTALENNSDFERSTDFIDGIADYSGPDVSIEQLVNAGGFNDDLKAFINAQIGNEYGTDNSKLGADSLAVLDNLWTAGDKNFMIKGASMYEVLAQEFSEELGFIKYNKVVNSINYSGNIVEVSTADGNTYTANKVIIAVPLSILKSNTINFSPILPVAKQEAIDKIGFGKGMKIIMKFSQRFWAEDTGSIFGKGFVPEFWATGAGRGTNNILTAFIMGEKAEYLSSLGNSAYQQVLMQLDAMYGNNIATNSYLSHYKMDWIKEPFIQGSYSFPAPNSKNSFLQLSLPIDNKLYFAGEATNYTGHNATVHGAIESGITCSDNIIKDLR